MADFACAKCGSDNVTVTIAFKSDGPVVMEVTCSDCGHKMLGEALNYVDEPAPEPIDPALIVERTPLFVRARGMNVSIAFPEACVWCNRSDAEMQIRRLRFKHTTSYAEGSLQITKTYSLTLDVPYCEEHNAECDRRTKQRNKIRDYAGIGAFVIVYAVVFALFLPVAQDLSPVGYQILMALIIPLAAALVLGTFVPALWNELVGPCHMGINGYLVGEGGKAVIGKGAPGGIVLLLRNAEFARRFVQNNPYVVLHRPPSGSNQ